MFTGDEITTTLDQLGVTHVVWLPDTYLGQWESALESANRLNLIRVCREGEAWPLAAGLIVAGKRPIVMMQTTGLFESGDAMRNVMFDLKLPVFAIVGARNWLVDDSNDSAKRLALPVIKAWGARHWILGSQDDKPLLRQSYEACLADNTPAIALIAEGKG